MSDWGDIGAKVVVYWLLWCEETTYVVAWAPVCNGPVDVST